MLPSASDMLDPEFDVAGAGNARAPVLAGWDGDMTSSRRRLWSEKSAFALLVASMSIYLDVCDSLGLLSSD